MFSGLLCKKCGGNFIRTDLYINETENKQSAPYICEKCGIKFTIRNYEVPFNINDEPVYVYTFNYRGEKIEMSFQK